jgi:hypothetical protein
MRFFNISGNNQEAVQTVLKLLTSIGLKTSAKKIKLNKKNQMSKSILFQPYTLEIVFLKNRMVMAPMTRSRSNNEGNVPTA